MEMSHLAANLAQDFINRGRESEDLDEGVLIAAVRSAHSANQNGLEGQVEFLLDHGYTEDDIYKLLGEWDEATGKMQF